MLHRSSVVSYREQKQTSSMVHNTKGHIILKYINIRNKRTTSLELKGSERVVSDDKPDLNDLHDIKTSLGSKGSDRLINIT